MSDKRKVEIFSAGCQVCEDTVDLVNKLVCSSCDVTILDMKNDAVAQRAKDLGIKSVPAVAVDGKLASCCEGQGPTEEALRAAGVGQA